MFSPKENTMIPRSGLRGEPLRGVLLHQALDEVAGALRDGVLPCVYKTYTNMYMIIIKKEIIVIIMMIIIIMCIFRCYTDDNMHIQDVIMMC